MVLNKSNGTAFIWLVPALMAVLAAGVLSLSLYALYFGIIPIDGSMPHDETQTLQALCCNGSSWPTLLSVIEVTTAAVLILIPIFLWPVIEFRNESPFASFWRRIEESNAKKTAPSKSQMAGALLLPGVVILLAVSMYFVGFLVH